VKNERIRILHVLPILDVGGAECMTVQLATSLPPDVFSPAVVSLFDGVGSRLEGTLAGNDVPLWHLGKRKGFDPRIYKRLKNIITAFGPHVLHTHLGVLNYAAPMLVGDQRIKAVHTMHRMAERDGGRITQWLHRRMFRRRVVPVAVAREVAESLVRHYRLVGVKVIPNGIPVDRYRAPGLSRDVWRAREGFARQEVLLVCVARMRRVKNHSMLLRAFAASARLRSCAKLLIVGAGELEAVLRQEAGRLGIEGAVRFMGERGDVASLLHASDAFVLSSDSEANPLSVMEAMAAGLPVVCTRVGGIPELVREGVHGLLVARGDTSGITKALEIIAGDATMRALMGKRGAAQARESFDSSLMVDGYARLYQSLLQRRTPVEAVA
jgi:glycosyltransferase involved in cell wall biosynthesis